MKHTLGKARLSGTALYCMTVPEFRRDEKLARPLALEEIQNVQIQKGKGALRTFLGQWDAAVEKLTQISDLHENDIDCLYIAFRKQFMKADELSEQQAKVRRSLPDSKVHSYAWMYRAAKAVVESQRLHTQEVERADAQLPRAPDPLTPDVDHKKKKGKGRGKGKSDKSVPAVPDRNTENEACPRMVSSGKCSFGDKCWYSHAKHVIDAEKKRQQTGKASARAGRGPCTYFAKGKCARGDRCPFTHEETNPLQSQHTAIQRAQTKMARLRYR